MASGNKSMELDFYDGNNGSMPVLRENGLVPRAVAAGESGEGLPYAPEDWPNPGDTWTWKVGKRKSISGFWFDRYLYPPSRLQKTLRKKTSFASKPSLEQYIRKEFPDADVNAFLNSFIWKVPSSKNAWLKVAYAESDTYYGVTPKKSDVIEHSGSESTSGTAHCKAGNKMCDLRIQARSYSLAAIDCDLCCSETNFCRDCCCILCCKTIDWAYGGYSFIRCESKVNENYICGHVAHIDCALRSYLAGTVGGSIGLDVEYYCRRCDKKTDLISHVTRLLQMCESLDSRDDIEKILNIGSCILRDSEQISAKSLQNRIELISTKLKSGTYLEEIWRVEDNMPAISAGEIPHHGNDVALVGPLDVTNGQNALELTAVGDDDDDGRAQTPVYITSDYRIASLNIENDVDRALQTLRRSQESEYRIAEEKLYAQKDFLLSLYQQLDLERSELANHTSGPDGDFDPHLSNVLSRVDQIKQEVIKLRDMRQVAQGFGRTSKSVLKEYFGLPVEED